MAAHGLFRVVGIAGKDGFEDGLMTGTVHLIDARATLHRAPMLGQPIHIGLVDRWVDWISRDSIKHSVKSSVGFIEQGRIADCLSVGVKRNAEFFEVVA